MPDLPPPPDDAAQARVLARSPAQSFRNGMVQSLPFLVVLIPFGLLFGVIASEAGLDLLQILGFSVLVLAGASQFTAVQLLSDNVPALLAVVSALAVNLRMAMYSASLVPWLGSAPGWHRSAVAYLLVDQTYALAIQKYELNPRLSLKQRLAYFYGAAAAMCIPWAISSMVGATVGRAIPETIALDFVIPITFLAMIAPMLRTWAHRIAALVAVVMALALSWMPAGTGLLIAAPIGMAAGALVETWQERRQRGTR
ncbi:branched-chain amino acid transporter AzlC [Paracoccus tegillarcae]|uniref:Branched-chain amino acid transporter AzlC n=2 Tax=Paracoccus tegillarcae TaxID=1529068 RepID=A0A2K9EMD4_9RHOB|nr:branched-chain amino acid transporter AzlC [Paracoccus tegillarcae]